MGFRKIDAATRVAAASEALEGEPVSDVARRYGVSEQSVRNWAESVLGQRKRLRAQIGDVRRGDSPTAVLVDLRTESGPVLALVNVGRGGRPTGTLQRVAGARVGPDLVLRGVPVRKWTVDAVRLHSMLGSLIENCAI